MTGKENGEIKRLSEEIEALTMEYRQALRQTMQSLCSNSDPVASHDSDRKELLAEIKRRTERISRISSNES